MYIYPDVFIYMYRDTRMNIDLKNKSMFKNIFLNIDLLLIYYFVGITAGVAMKVNSINIAMTA